MLFILVFLSLLSKVDRVRSPRRDLGCWRFFGVRVPLAQKHLPSAIRDGSECVPTKGREERIERKSDQSNECNPVAARRRAVVRKSNSNFDDQAWTDKGEPRSHAEIGSRTGVTAIEQLIVIELNEGEPDRASARTNAAGAHAH